MLFVQQYNNFSSFFYIYNVTFAYEERACEA